MLGKIIELPKIGEPVSGFLSFAESKRAIPFEIKKILFIYSVKNPAAVRGMHAHRKLEEVFFCLHGRVKFLLRDGTKEETVILDRPEKGLYIPPMVWRILMDFDPGTVVMSVASDFHSEEDYIRNYEEFLRATNRPHHAIPHD